MHPISQNFLSAVVKQNSSSCGKIPLRPFPSVGGTDVKAELSRGCSTHLITSNYRAYRNVFDTVAS